MFRQKSANPKRNTVIAVLPQNQESDMIAIASTIVANPTLVIYTDADSNDYVVMSASISDAQRLQLVTALTVSIQNSLYTDLRFCVLQDGTVVNTNVGFQGATGRDFLAHLGLSRNVS